MDRFPLRVAFCVLAAVSLFQAAEPRQIENRQLVWTDFRGEPEGSSPYDAYTYWSVHYSYDAPTPEGGGYRVSVLVWNQLGNRSWVKPHVYRDPLSAELLNHEQGHYTLGVLCALEFKKASSGRLFSPQYRVEIQNLFDQVLKKYVEMEKAYDAETLHMRNQAAQRAWDRRLAQLVSELWADR